MRGIKFQAWVPERKVMVEVISVNFKDNTVQLPIQTDVNSEYWWDETTWDLSKIELLQFTGLKDKNGKEIYEGDVVKGYWWQKGKSHRHIGKVTYGMAAFKVVGVKQYFGMNDELNPVYEVIGNIYENPKLLEESK